MPGADRPSGVPGSQTGSSGLPHLRQYPAGHEIFHQGDQADDVFLIEHGLVKILLSNPDGKDWLDLRSDSCFLAACDVGLSADYQVTAVTVVPSLLARIDGADFRQRLHDDAAFSWKINEQHCQEIRELRLRVFELLFVPADECLLRRMWSVASLTCAEAPDIGTEFDLPLKMEEVAQWVGVTPQTVSRLFKGLTAKKAISRKDRRLTLLRRPSENFI
ncbi:MAG TPA: Crp/Fnr family transcriptional regulator [Candidatus Eisenbacteria bacterium]|nr:Crp/Fnr family transcriptional regulator [Candidatus Eisenbacteria bacterium]